MNDDPSTILDDEIHVSPRAGPRQPGGIALPDGYFQCDWDTFQNYTVTRHLADAYGYRPLGIGASWIGFERDTPLSRLKANELIEELKPIYGSIDAPGWTRFEDALTRRPRRSSSATPTTSPTEKAVGLVQLRLWSTPQRSLLPVLHACRGRVGFAGRAAGFTRRP